MILRRFSQALKEQNWAAIWIEFVLLVAGVFLGIQVSNWNEQRVTDKKAAMFTERLREDLRVEAWRFAATNYYYDDVLANVRKALAALEGRATLSHEELLIAAYRATQYGETGQYRATYDELTSTGNIGLVADLSLRKIANEVYGTTLYQNLKDEGINSRFRVAFRMLVPIHIQETLTAKCGDIAPDIGDYDGAKNSLDYDCSTGLTAQEIDDVAAALRSDPALVPLLRLRVANINSAISTPLMSREVADALSDGKP